MRIGFDIDGVLALFQPAYQRLFVELTGKDLFQPGDIENPPCWDWPQLRGYSDEEVKLVWAHIKSSPDFWLSLSETPHMQVFRSVSNALLAHDVYFITDRPGVRTKTQTEDWLIMHSGQFNPTVIVSSQKGLCCAALKLDAYIDDKRENVLDVLRESPETRVYLLDRAYNQGDTVFHIPAFGEMYGEGYFQRRYATRVGSLAEFLELENI